MNTLKIYLLTKVITTTGTEGKKSINLTNYQKGRFVCFVCLFVFTKEKTENTKQKDTKLRKKGKKTLKPRLNVK